MAVKNWFLVKSTKLFLLVLCSSRKYPYPPSHGRDFACDPPSPLDFLKSAHKMDPSPHPSGNSIFVAHPLKILSFLVEAKNKLFFIHVAQNTQFWTWYLFSEDFGGYCDQQISRRYMYGCLLQNLQYENYRFNTVNSSSEFWQNSIHYKISFPRPLREKCGKRNALLCTSNNKIFRACFSSVRWLKAWLHGEFQPG